MEKEKQNGSTPAVETLPTVVLKDRIGEYYFPEGECFEFILLNENDKKFAMRGSMAAAVVLREMCDKVIQGAHMAKPGMLYFKTRQEASVGSSDELRGHVFIQFEGAMAYIISLETALRMVGLIEGHAKRQMTDEDWKKYNQKKAPMIIQPPIAKSRIIRP